MTLKSKLDFAGISPNDPHFNPPTEEHMLEALERAIEERILDPEDAYILGLLAITFFRSDKEVCDAADQKILDIAMEFYETPEEDNYRKDEPRPTDKTTVKKDGKEPRGLLCSC